MPCNAQLHNLYCWQLESNQLQLLDYQASVLLYTTLISTQLNDITTAKYANACYEYGSMLYSTSNNTRAMVGVSQYHLQLALRIQNCH